MMDSKQILREERCAASSRIVLVEDHQLVLESLCRGLQGVPGVTVCAAVHSAGEALRLPDLGRADLALIDVSLPDMNGIGLVRVLREQHPDLRCLMVSDHLQRSYVADSFSAGAYGYVFKDNIDELIQAIQCVRMGQTYLCKMFRR